MTNLSTGAVALVIAGMAVVGVIGLAFYLGRRLRPLADAGAEGPDLARRLDEVRTALATGEGALGAQVAQLDTKLASLQESVVGREATLDEQVRGIGAQMQGITSLFTNDRARGGWAEIGMKRIFEQGGLVEGRDFTCQAGGPGVKPDALIHLPGDRKIVIDAKFPTARYLEALAEPDPARRRRLLADQGRELERLGKDLTARGYTELACGGYVVMYLPSQAVYEAAAEAHPELIDRLMTNRVIIAGPSTLYALLLTVGSVLTEFKALQQADQILDEARELQRRMTKFVAHLQGIGAGLAAAVRAFNGAIGSWGSRVSPQLDRMAALTGYQEPAVMSTIDDAIREAPEAEGWDQDRVGALAN